MLTSRKLLRVVKSVALFAVFAFGTANVTAQTETRRRPQPQPGRTPPPPATASPQQAPQASATSPETADLAITANVTARELLFEVVPNPTVEFTGQPRRETVWEADRQNLPRPVQPGVTYRDIGIRLRITSVFADIDRIVAEALGEVPVSDDANDSTAPPPQQQSTPSDSQSPTPEGRQAKSSPPPPQNSSAPVAAPRAGTKLTARATPRRRGTRR